jgi:hypothetical protein
MLVEETESRCAVAAETARSDLAQLLKEMRAGKNDKRQKL